ncbi:MAG: sulfurtransferase [Candidatus Thiodiazotropha sp. (ex Lucinoma aequizonata)]|nr:sulfurtransferase [Candidatus Thiodiazotropha sp. (ex Lucinoma aequizonata)]MCU7888669.1 sulfurtransferase [Candidatus Thiodiazotropha sp. (ex Lucinoma aequizonata)]MCU7894478.1 sulfurtransferase [Candidatus Thiodiazotropha sp. (ex Lucinoma aequizonata)]MCU7899934.1 sulfurtransferase [Candidatus Thiodiazotropha sp. (ex Lucinoma aequizonata)]MCU7901179.1 sulfurtransferase [Candidatus Thiodiazotropha sp. (ex Lucinoma aequizonata)]
MINEIDASDLQTRIAEGDEFLLLDIRNAGELAQGVLPDAEHIPMHLIHLRISELPKDKEVILYCHSGALPYHACAYLAQRDFQNAINLRGGILGWARSGFQLAARLAS